MTCYVRCPSCGPVELVDGDLCMRVCADDLRTELAFHCPHCHAPVVAPITAWAADRLANAGIAVTVWQLPAELFEWHPDGPPITYDDLIDFHQAISRQDWLTSL